IEKITRNEINEFGKKLYESMQQLLETIDESLVGTFNKVHKDKMLDAIHKHLTDNGMHIDRETADSVLTKSTFWRMLIMLDCLINSQFHGDSTLRLAAIATLMAVPGYPHKDRMKEIIINPAGAIENMESDAISDL